MKIVKYFDELAEQNRLDELIDKDLYVVSFEQPKMLGSTFRSHVPPTQVQITVNGIEFLKEIFGTYGFAYYDISLYKKTSTGLSQNKQNIHNQNSGKDVEIFESSLEAQEYYQKELEQYIQAQEEMLLKEKERIDKLIKKSQKIRLY